ncbi:hypothetical protein ACHAQI_012386, partial [Fusarium lateritium]
MSDSNENSEKEILATIDEILVLFAKKLELKHMVETTIGDDLVSELKPYKTVLEQQQRAVRYPPWGEISDSDEDSDNEVLA